MILIKQNNPELHRYIQKWGCRFRCLQAIAEFELNKALSAEQIMYAYRMYCEETDVMNKYCLCGPKEHKIINWAFSFFRDYDIKGIQIGMMKNGVPTGWSGEQCTFDYVILHWNTQTADGHYTLADKNRNEIFDPWDNINNDMVKISLKRELLYKINKYKKGVIQ